MGSSKIQGELWNDRASDWADYQELLNTPLFEAMLNVSLVNQNTRFLDIGCGSGTSSDAAHRRGARVEGLDAASVMIDIAKKRVPSANFQVGDMEDLPFEDESFDVVFAANSIQFASDRANALNEMKRVCLERGYIVIGLFGESETVDLYGILKAIGSTLPNPPKGDGPFGLSDYAKLETLFASVGLTILTRQYVNCPYVYPDVHTFWLAISSGGPSINAIRQVGEDKVKNAVLEVAQPFIHPDGEVRLEQNHFQYLVAKKSS